MFYLNTPCVESEILAEIAGIKNVFLKLECLQPSGSFKIRGISHLIQKKLKEGKTKLACSSGGNAGMAAAYVAKKLKVPINIYVPKSTNSLVIQKLKKQEANVVIHGEVWNEADRKCREECYHDQVAYVPPFDHPLIWEGNSSLIEEAVQQVILKPDLVVVSVGGGGLLMGVAKGMETVGWQDVPIIAMETQGADCFHRAVEAGYVVSLPSITSVASSLGALSVCKEVMSMRDKRTVHSVVVSDKESIEGVLFLLDNHRLLVEPSCGASVAFITSGILNKLKKEKLIPEKIESVLLIICGGIATDLQLINEWKKLFNV